MKITDMPVQVGTLYVGVTCDDGETVEVFQPGIPPVETMTLDVPKPSQFERFAVSEMPVATITLTAEEARKLRALLDSNYRCICTFPRVQRRFPDARGVDNDDKAQ